MRNRIQSVIILAATLVLGSTAWAQWSSDPMVNLALADKPDNDQVQPKVRPLPDNGWYVSWFDSDPHSSKPIGYDVYYQHLDQGGVEQFVHDGVQIADLSNSSTEDYGLDIDRDGNALLAFLDTREGPNQQVTAVRMDPSGRAMWGTLGVQVTADPNFHAAPKITGTTNGIIVAWTSNSSVVLQKLTPTGHRMWGQGLVLSQTGYNYSLSDMHAAEDGSFIVSWVRDQGFGTNRNIEAMKFSAAGRPLWGRKPIVVFDGGSLQFGNFPGFVYDGNGGAVFGWYSSSPSLQCYAQHIRADGTEAFPHNGAVASTNSSRIRVEPSVSYSAATDETFLSWTEEDSLQFFNGVYAQKFDSTGNRKWGQSGLEIVPLGTDSQIFVRTVQTGTGALVFWVDQPSFVSATIQAVRLDGQGNTTCAQFPVSSFSSSKGGLSAGISPSGVAALAFQDYRNGNSDIYIQNVNPDCSLGGSSQGTGK